MKDWLNIAKAVGIERFEIGLQKAWLECHFFPLPSEIRERIPESGDRMVIGYSSACESCWGLGWKPISGKPLKDDKYGRKERCHCRKIEFVRAV